jgi:hypothetical protein
VFLALLPRSAWQSPWRWVVLGLPAPPRRGRPVRTPRMTTMVGTGVRRGPGTTMGATTITSGTDTGAKSTGGTGTGATTTGAASTAVKNTGASTGATGTATTGTTTADTSAV